MREPRFRAWIERYKKYMPVAMIHFEPILGKIDYIEVVATGGDWAKFYPEEFILEQYTELKDKNGKEIYEGDIVGSDDGSRYLTGAVEWNEDYAKYEVIYSQLTGNSFEFEGDDGYPVANLCEVIGNIHENQDLLGDTNVIDKEEE